MGRKRLISLFLPDKVVIDSDYRKVYGERVSSPTISDAITLYQDEYLAARNLAPLTRTATARTSSRSPATSPRSWGWCASTRCSPGYLQGFLVTLDRRGLRGSSRRRKVATIRSLFRFLVQQGILPASPAEESCHRSGNGRNGGCSPRPSTSG